MTIDVEAFILNKKIIIIIIVFCLYCIYISITVPNKYHVRTYKLPTEIL